MHLEALFQVVLLCKILCGSLGLNNTVIGVVSTVEEKNLLGELLAERTRNTRVSLLHLGTDALRNVEEVLSSFCENIVLRNVSRLVLLQATKYQDFILHLADYFTIPVIDATGGQLMVSIICSQNKIN